MVVIADRPTARDGYRLVKALGLDKFANEDGIIEASIRETGKGTWSGYEAAMRIKDRKLYIVIHGPSKPWHLLPAETFFEGSTSEEKTGKYLARNTYKLITGLCTAVPRIASESDGAVEMEILGNKGGKVIFKVDSEKEEATIVAAYHKPVEIPGRQPRGETTTPPSTTPT